MLAKGRHVFLAVGSILLRLCEQSQELSLPIKGSRMYIARHPAKHTLYGLAILAWLLLLLGFVFDGVSVGAQAYAIDNGRLVLWPTVCEYDLLDVNGNVDPEAVREYSSWRGLAGRWVPRWRFVHMWRTPPWRPATTVWDRVADAMRFNDTRWWRLWLHPFDCSTDGEYSETGAKPIPLTCLVYATSCAALVAWKPWALVFRRPGVCRRCGYELISLPCSSGRRICPECGTGSHGASSNDVPQSQA